MRLTRPRRPSDGDGDLPDVPIDVPERAMAPDWVSPTEGNGSDAPRAELHIALIAPNAEVAKQLRTVRVVKPPLWKGGKILLHVLTPNRLGIDLSVAQALVDLGLVDSKDVTIEAPDGIELGYPSGLTGDMR